VSYFRPAALAVLARLAEPAVAGLAALWLGLEAVGLIAAGRLFGLVVGVLALAAGAWCVAAAMRAAITLRALREGPGLVLIQEGRISYWGPHGGGIVALDSLVAVALVPDRESGAAWELIAEDGTCLWIPQGAKNADALPDTLAILPGFDAMAAIGGPGQRPGARRTVWTRPGRPAPLPPH